MSARYIIVIPREWMLLRNKEKETFAALFQATELTVACRARTYWLHSPSPSSLSSSSPLSLVIATYLTYPYHDNNAAILQLNYRNDTPWFCNNSISRSCPIGRINYRTFSRMINAAETEGASGQSIGRSGMRSANPANEWRPSGDGIFLSS